MQPPDLRAAAAAGKLEFVSLSASGLVRITRFPGTEPHYGKRATNRFDDPRKAFGVLYAATDPAVAFAETVLHERGQFIDGAWLVARSHVETRALVVLERPEPLKLLNLRGAALKRLGLDNSLSADADYGFTQDLSRAVYEQVPEADGILYVSRQLNDGIAAALFDRCGCGVSGRVTPLISHYRYACLLETFGVEFIDG